MMKSLKEVKLWIMKMKIKLFHTTNPTNPNFYFYIINSPTSHQVSFAMAPTSTREIF